MTDQERSGNLNSESTNSTPLGVTTAAMVRAAQRTYNQAAHAYRSAINQAISPESIERTHRELSYRTDLLMSVALDYARSQR